MANEYECADMREVYRRLAERHADELNELRKSDGLSSERNAGPDSNSLRFTGSGVEGR